MDTVALFAALTLLAALLSAWAHLAPQRAGLRTALYVVFGGASLLAIVIGALVAAGGGSGASSGMLSAAVGLAVGLPLLRPVRRAFARVIPIDPDSIPDMVGLALTLGAAVFFGGSTLSSGDDLDVGSVDTIELVGQAVTLVLMGYLGVGFLVTRDFASATRRLGIGRLTSREVLISLGMVLVAFAISIAAALLTAELQPELEEEIRERTIELTSDVSSFSGALTLGISAGVGEEVLFRGAMQPRFGLWLTSIIFALVHVQYGFSITNLGIVAIGLLFGWQRQRYNTTSAIITHVVYDVIVVLLSTIDPEA